MERHVVHFANDKQPSAAIAIQWTPLQQQNEGRDDWTGITSTAERRRRQNRIHQRAYRQRRLGISNSAASTAQSAAVGVVQDAAVGCVVLNHHGDQAPSRGQTCEGYDLLTSPEARTAWETFATRAYRDYQRGTPQLGHLGFLVKINVLAALASNADLLGFNFAGLCCPNLISPFSQQGPGLGIASPRPPYPESLQPTRLQFLVPHHPWIDLIPLPRLRDNILRTIREGAMDNTPLAMDILDVQDLRSEAACLIVWGESWSPDGWEISIPFLRKWGDVLDGCDEMIEATNAWRRTRNERQIAYTSRHVP